jgi:biopolymer transport protein ExbD
LALSVILIAFILDTQPTNTSLPANIPREKTNQAARTKSTDAASEIKQLKKIEKNQIIAKNRNPSNSDIENERRVNEQKKKRKTSIMLDKQCHPEIGGRISSINHDRIPFAGQEKQALIMLLAAT